MRALRVAGPVLVAAVVAAVVSALVVYNRGLITGDPVSRGPLPQVGQQEGAQAAAQRAAASVVRIETGPASSPVPGPVGKVGAGGSGVIIDSRGYVLTAQAAVAGASRVTVAVPGQKTLDARVVGSDPLTGVTLLKIDGSFKAVTLGGAGPLDTGNGIVVMAAPPAIQLAVGAVALAHGTVSIDDAAAPGNHRTLNDVVALDVAARDGQLGAPLLDGAGRVVGVVIATGATTWAADATNAQPDVSQLIDTGRVSYPWLDFEYRQLSVSEAADRELPGGVVVLRVVPASAADQAGLRAGDVVVSVGGQVLDITHPLDRLVRGLAVRQSVTAVARPAQGGADRNLNLVVDLVSA
ncbi:MAG: serine protease Do [Chloroflexota bacterium]|nr:serine protease Do [Chloroflexota bacterium]